MRLLNFRVFQLFDLHVAGSFTQDSVVNGAKLLHVLLEKFLSDIPRNIPHKQSRILHRVICIFLSLLPLSLLLLFNFLCSIFICLIISSGSLLLFLFKFNTLWFNDILLCLVCVVDYMLHFSFV